MCGRLVAKRSFVSQDESRKQTNLLGGRNLLIATVFTISILFGMKLFRGVCRVLASLVLGLSLAAVPGVRAADSLSWKADSVAAEISSWDLGKLLQKLTEATGWQIYVEPEPKHSISTKF